MSKRNIVILVVVLLLAITSVVVIVATLRGSGGEADPYKTDTTQTKQQPENQAQKSDDADNQGSNQPAVQTPSVNLDPATVSEIDIPAFGVTVSYVKGIPGFAYVIQRATNNTEYVEFTSDQLVSNRCTDDKGVFATIIKNAQSGADSATVSATTKVGGVTYGLSLAAETCAADKALLQTYQKSFKDAFSLLKASTSNQ